MTAGRSSGAAAMALFVHSGAVQPQRYCRGLPVRKNLTAKNVKKGTYSVHEKSIDFMNGI